MILRNSIMYWLDLEGRLLGFKSQPEPRAHCVTLGYFLNYIVLYYILNSVSSPTKCNTGTV